MDALYRYGAPYGMGEEPPQTSGEPGQTAPSTWETVKKIGSELWAQGIKVAPELIKQKLADKVKAGAADAIPGRKPKSKPAPAVVPPRPPSRGLPSWVVPAAVGGAALVGVVLFLRRRKG